MIQKWQIKIHHNRNYPDKIRDDIQVISEKMPGFDPITFTFNENSNYWRESLLEVIGQKIAG